MNCSLKYRYLDNNILLEKKNSCDDCFINNEGEPSFSLYEYIYSVVQDLSCCGGTDDLKTCGTPCEYDIIINKFYFVNKPKITSTLGDRNHFDLWSLVMCVLVEQCGLPTNSVYEKNCLCKTGCCPKELHIPLTIVRMEEFKGCKKLDRNIPYISLYNLIIDIAQVYCTKYS